MIYIVAKIGKNGTIRLKNNNNNNKVLFPVPRSLTRHSIPPSSGLFVFLFVCFFSRSNPFVISAFRPLDVAIVVAADSVYSVYLFLFF